MAYNNTIEYEKAVNIAKQVIDSAIKMQDSTLLVESLRIAATSSYAQKKSREALSFYSKLQEVGGNNSLHLRDIQNMAESYAQIGDNHKSDSIMQYCLDYNFISEERYPSFSFWHSQRVMSSISRFSLCLLLLQFSIRSNSSSTGFHCSITAFSCSVNLSCSIKSRYVSIINTSRKNIFDL